MALEDIFQALEEQADKEIEEILQDARDQAAAIDEEAIDEAEAVRQRLVGEMARVTQSQGTRTTNAARLESKKQIAAIKQEAVEASFDAALDRLAEQRATKDYADIFRSLAEEAVVGLDGEMDVLVDPADVQLAESAFDDLGIQVTVAGELETTGGLVVRTHGGRIMRRNTFEERLEKVRHLIQSDVAEILFT
jgi:V/A-type H+-transporting ATPase subunit E